MVEALLSDVTVLDWLVWLKAAADAPANNTTKLEKIRTLAGPPFLSSGGVAAINARRRGKGSSARGKN
jgi:hypothetical protein